MRHYLAGALGAFISVALSSTVLAETLTIATVNNGDMIRMQKLTDDFKAKNPGVDLEWVTLEENVLRQKVTTDIATKGGQYDVLTIGTYEVPIWAKQGWLVPLDNLGANYDVDDLLPAIRSGLTMDGKLYAAPFYGESSMVMYRKDLFDAAGLKMPDAPTWDFIADAARKITNKDKEVYGICLRGKAGWGENMAFLTAMSNSFGARWFDESWKPQFDQPEWKDTLDFYVKLMKDAGPPGASSNGFNENLALFQTGKCGMWIDATVAASFVSNPKESTVADKVGFALAPDKGLGKRGNWLWAWSLAIPAGSQKAEAAEKFVAWATSKDYTNLVAEKEGWLNAPPGTRKSLYANAEYQKAAPFATTTLDSINAADPSKPTVKPVPYVGIQFVAIPEFQGIGTAVGQQFSAALAGQL
ncbi:ABC transporter substrate-binding protein, partial [Rhizobium leguminosarum]|uniref:ABC transporter substrate-binding protein n=1 Tax=Rhizobium leguminosarum TaxID=384 RepID=UPI001441EB4B